MRPPRQLSLLVARLIAIYGECNELLIGFTNQQTSLGGLSLYVCMYAWMHVCMYACMYMHVYACLCMFMRACIYIYITTQPNGIGLD